MIYNNPRAAGTDTKGWRRRLLPVIGLMACVLAPVSQAVADQHYKSIWVERGGVIAGKVFARRVTPKAERFVIAKQTEVCGGEHRDHPVISVRDAMLQDVVVYLEGVSAGKSFRAAASKITINQQGCRFVPYLSVLMQGGELEVVNSDPVLHNIHIYELVGMTRRNFANISQPRKGDIATMSVHLSAGTALKIECDAHNFMHAFVFVARNPYFAVVGTDGTYELMDVPPGRYTIHAWHPYLGDKQQAIDIVPGTRVQLDFWF